MDGSKMSFQVNEDPIVYKVKKFLKTWESNYVNINGKEPNKTDIPDDLRVLYKVYKRIKEEPVNEATVSKIEDLLIDLNEIYNISGLLKNKESDRKSTETQSISSSLKFSPSSPKKQLGPVLLRADSTPDMEIASVPQPDIKQEKASEELINDAVDGIIVHLKPVEPLTVLPKIQIEQSTIQSPDLVLQKATELNLENAVLTKRVPMNTILQCRVQRTRKIMPIYSIFNECDGRELCRIKKVMKGYKVYSIKNGEEKWDYTIDQVKDTYTVTDTDGTIMMSTSLESTVPRNVSITIYENNKNIRFLNRQPRWNPENQTYTMNFEGRVTEPSVKNFVFVGDGDINVLLFGRTGKTDFIMDCRFPLRPDQAICAMISVFDAVDRQ
eukprot:NODE_11_length_54881_cov_1.430718.p19 type:complete len:383 gc:universal NODE_11_length_54881_cov_1.430718:51392-52540(+)